MYDEKLSNTPVPNYDKELLVKLAPAQPLGKLPPTTHAENHLPSKPKLSKVAAYQKQQTAKFPPTCWCCCWGCAYCYGCCGVGNNSYEYRKRTPTTTVRTLTRTRKSSKAWKHLAQGQRWQQKQQQRNDQNDESNTTNNKQQLSKTEGKIRNAQTHTHRRKRKRQQ